MRISLPLIAGLVLAGALVAGCGSGSGASPSTSLSPTPSGAGSGATPAAGPGVTDAKITVGMTNDLTGSGDTPYAAITLAMRAYLTKVNTEDGGACGRELELAAEDDGYAPARALEGTRKLVDAGQVLAMVGGLGTEAQQGVAVYLNDPNANGNKDDGVPDLFISSAWSGWSDTGQYPWTIGYIPDYFTDGVVLGRYVSSALGGQKVGIIYSDDAMGRDYLAGLEAGISDKSLLVSRQPFAPGAASVAEPITRVKTDGAQIVLLAATPEASVLAINEAGVQTYAPRWLLSYTNAPSRLASALGGGTAADQLLAGFGKLDGAISTQYLLSPVEDEEQRTLAEHARIMQTYSGPAVSSLTVYGQSLAEVLVETVNRSCSNLTRQGLMDAAESLDGYASSLMRPGIAVKLGDADHRAIQSLQPVMIHADSTITAEGEVISAEDVQAPAVVVTPTPPG